MRVRATQVNQPSDPRACKKSGSWFLFGYLVVIRRVGGVCILRARALANMRNPLKHNNPWNIEGIVVEFIIGGGFSQHEMTKTGYSFGFLRAQRYSP